MSAIRINGIRVGHQMYVLGQCPEQPDAAPDAPLFLSLARAKMNMPCLGLERFPSASSLSCCVEEPLSSGSGISQACQPAAMVSVYPHGSSTATLGCLLTLFGEYPLPFFHMVSSNAMISFVMAEAHRATALKILESTFDLPPTHTPYEPGFHEETAAFVKRRYQETRAYFQEHRIKTYGFSLERGLTLTALNVPASQLVRAGRAITGIDTKFHFSTALLNKEDFHIYCLTGGKVPPGGEFEGTGHGGAVDLITFHGPHFGDRFGIFNQAAGCLDSAGVPMLLAGCTGASVSLVVPLDQGKTAISALERGFEAP